MKSDILERFSGGNPSVEKSKNLKKFSWGESFPPASEKSSRMSDFILKIEKSAPFWAETLSLKNEKGLTNGKI